MSDKQEAKMPDDMSRERMKEYFMACDVSQPRLDLTFHEEARIRNAILCLIEATGPDKDAPPEGREKC